MLLSQLAEKLGGELIGDGGSEEVSGVSTIRDAGPGEVCYFGNEKYRSGLNDTSALAVISSERVSTSAGNIILVENPYMSFREVLLLFEDGPPSGFQGVHPSAVIHPEAVLHRSVEVAPNAVIDTGTRVGEGTTIGAGSFVGPECVIGSDCIIHSGVSIYRRSVLGDRVIVHSRAVIGSDGFGFVPNPDGHRKIPHIGSVEIANDVEIGAGTTIDRAVVGATRIGEHTKVDNLVQIAHNVTIGPGCFVASQTGIAGSTTIGAGVVCGGQAGITGHALIGDGVVIGAQAGVSKDIPPGITVSGYPARPHGEALRISAAMADLPELRRRIIRFMQENDRRMEEDN